MMSLLSRGNEDDDDSFRRSPSLSRRDNNTLRLADATDDSFRRSPSGLSRRDDSTLSLASSNMRPLELMLNDLDGKKDFEADDCGSLDTDLPSLASIHCGSVFSTRTMSISKREDDLSIRGGRDGRKLRNSIMMDLLREEQTATSLSLAKTLEILEPVASNGNALKKEARWANSSASNLLLSTSNHSTNLNTSRHDLGSSIHSAPPTSGSASLGRHNRPKVTLQSTRGKSTSPRCMSSKGSGRDKNILPPPASSRGGGKELSLDVAGHSALCGRASQRKGDKLSSKDPRAELASSNHSASGNRNPSRSSRRGVVPPSRVTSSNNSSLELLSTSSSHSSTSNREQEISMPSLIRGTSQELKEQRRLDVRLQSGGALPSTSGHSACSVFHGDDAPRKPCRKTSADAETIRNASADTQGRPRRGRRKPNSSTHQQDQHHSKDLYLPEESLPKPTADGRRRSIDCHLAPPQRSRSGQ